MKHLTELKLWCVQCTPANLKSDARMKKELLFLLRGPGKPTVGEEEIDPRSMVWTALAMTGIGDNRQAHYATKNRRLLIFRTRGAAENYSRKEGSKNKYWTFKAQEVRFADPDESDCGE